MLGVPWWHCAKDTPEHCPGDTLVALCYRHPRGIALGATQWHCAEGTLERCGRGLSGGTAPVVLGWRGPPVAPHHCGEHTVSSLVLGDGMGW